jgi:putative tricarboxylic transport membrane protein
VVATNWRGLFAAPGVTAEARATLTRFVSALHRLPAWKTLLETRGWDDAFLEGEAFEAFLQRDRADTEGVLKDLGLA